jgi:putative ABC transport system permease protein
MRLAWWLVRAQFTARRGASALSMLAIALGVALGYAIHLINAAALADFGRAMKTVQGEPDAVIAPREAGGSVPLDLLDRLARDEGVALVVPVVDVRVRLDPAATLVRLLGIDPFSAALLTPALLPTDAEAMAAFLDGGVFAAPETLAELGLELGARATATRGDARWVTQIAGTLPAAPAAERLLVADLAWVQARFGPAGGVSELRLRLAGGTAPAEWRERLAASLPPTLVLRGADDEAARVANISRAYRVNLNVLALVALLTGAFLVFATQLTAVAQRSTQFAVLGVLGLPPRALQGQVLAEGLALGLPAATAGLGLGYGLALAFTRLAGGDLGGGFFASSTPRLVVEFLPAIGFFVLGVGASLLGALYPAWLNRRQPLAQALKTGFAQDPSPSPAGKRRRRALSATALALAAAVLASMPPVGGLPLAGYAAIAVILALGVALAPLATRLVFGHLGRLALPAPLRIAVQGTVQAPLMAQVAASGLIVSFALTVSMVTMVSSFRGALEQWLDAVLPAPHYARSKGVPLPPSVFASATAPGAPFARVEGMAAMPLGLEPRRPTAMLLVREIERHDPGRRLPFTGEVVAVGSDRIPVWISEAMNELYGLRPGDRLQLPLAGREVEVVVSGIWRDYARQFGSIVIAAADYRALGGRVEPTDLALWPLPGREVDAAEWLRRESARHGFETASAGEIRELSLSIFDRSFAVTHALEAAALLIGLFGLAVTLAAGVQLRERELAMLSALGFDRAMLGRAVVFEALLVSLIGLLLGLGAGIAVGAVLVHVVNPQAFHWRMPLAVPWSQVLPVAAATLAAGVLASAVAARRATRMPAARVLAAAQ